MRSRSPPRDVFDSVHVLLAKLIRKQSASLEFRALGIADVHEFLALASYQSTALFEI